MVCSIVWIDKDRRCCGGGVVRGVVGVHQVGAGSREHMVLLPMHFINLFSAFY